MIICFEGPSAIGKTTLCKELDTLFLTIPEVNLLFKRPKEPTKFWYYDKQFERFSIANKATKPAILDGDLFQPLWYNWTYGFPKEFPNLAATIQHYKTGIEQSLVQFPDLYIIFTSDRATLLQRKEKDLSRKRRNFTKHLQLIQAQKKYFRFLKEQTDIQVLFVAYDDLDSTKAKVLKHIQSFSPAPNMNATQTLLKIGDWLKNTIP